MGNTLYNELVNEIEIIKEQYYDITSVLLKNSSNDIQFDFEEIKNPYGGNSEYKFYISGSLGGIPLKNHVITYQPQAQTKVGYLDAIRSYLFSIFDFIVNVL